MKRYKKIMIAGIILFIISQLIVPECRYSSIGCVANDYLDNTSYAFATVSAIIMLVGIAFGIYVKEGVIIDEVHAVSH